MAISLRIQFGERPRAASPALKWKDEWARTKEAFLVFEVGIPDKPLSFRCSLPKELADYNIGEETLVNACLKVDADWGEEDFALQVGLNPDNKIYFPHDKKDKEGWLLAGRKSRNNIFSNTFGPSALFLFYDREDQLPHPLLKIGVNVAQSLGRREMMCAVVGELISLAPQTITDVGSGQNASASEDGWSVGSTSFRYLPLELRSVEELVRNIEPELLSISNNPAQEILPITARMELCRVRKMTTRGLSRFSGMSASSQNQDLSNIRVSAVRRVRSFDVRAHRAIVSFLAKLHRRLCEMRFICQNNRADAEKSLDAIESLIVKSGNRDFEHDYGFRRKSVLENCRVIDDYLHKIDVIDSRVLKLRTLDFLSSIADHNIYSLSCQDFAFNHHYQRVFSLLLVFDRRHHWWQSIDDNGGFVHSRRLLSDGKYSNELQRKYSILFEYWAYWRLVNAFERIGFDFSAAKQELYKRISNVIVISEDYEEFSPVALLESKGIEVRLIHNYAAYDPEIKPEADFKTLPRVKKGKKEEETQDYETPDMAVVVRDMSNGKWFWCPIDAKSSRKLSTGQVAKQLQYLHQLHAPKFDQVIKSDEGTLEDEPNSSWLVYAGDLDGEAGLEFVKGENESQRCWQSEDVKEILSQFSLVSGGWAHCSVDEGIVRNPKYPRRKFIGEIRANPLTTKVEQDGAANDSDPFVRFAKIMVATVLQARSK